MSDMMCPDKVYKFMLEIKIKDMFVNLEDLLEYIVFRLNLKESCTVNKIYLLEDCDNVCNISKKENEKCKV